MPFFPSANSTFKIRHASIITGCHFFSGAVDSGSHFFLVPFLPVPFSPVPFFPDPPPPPPLPLGDIPETATFVEETGVSM